MSLNANALTSVANLRSYLQQNRTSGTGGQYAQTPLEDMINKVSSAIEQYLGRRLIAPAAAETYTLDGDGRAQIDLWRTGCWPIVSVTSVTNLASAEVIPARPSVTGSGYVLGDQDKLDGIIRLDGYTTDRGLQTVQVVAICGYDATTASGTTPVALAHRRALDVLRSACEQWGYHLWQTPNPGAENVTMEALSMTVRPLSIPTPVKALLDPLRRLSL